MRSIAVIVSALVISSGSPLLANDSRADFLGSGRIVPEMRSGRVVGLRVYSVSPASRDLGLQNGDLVLKVCGVPMTSPARALEVYPRLRIMCCPMLVERQGRKLDLVVWRP